MATQAKVIGLATGIASGFDTTPKHARCVVRTSSGRKLDCVLDWEVVKTADDGQLKRAIAAALAKKHGGEFVVTLPPPEERFDGPWRVDPRRFPQSRATTVRARDSKEVGSNDGTANITNKGVRPDPRNQASDAATGASQVGTGLTTGQTRCGPYTFDAQGHLIASEIPGGPPGNAEFGGKSFTTPVHFIPAISQATDALAKAERDRNDTLHRLEEEKSRSRIENANSGRAKSCCRKANWAVQHSSTTKMPERRRPRLMSGAFGQEPPRRSVPVLLAR